MKAPRFYYDSSVFLRIVLGEPDPLVRWPPPHTITSDLALVECLRSLDRLRFLGGKGAREVERRKASMKKMLSEVEQMRINRPVIEYASAPLRTLVRSLDAIHLASAMVVRDRGFKIRFATHDAGLAEAARAANFKVIGV